MFIPLEIRYPYERVHFATYGLLAVQLVVFLLTLDGIPLEYALNPVGSGDDVTRWLRREALPGFSLEQLITSGFLHDGWMHLFWNGLFLFVYGRYVEERLGPWRFLGVYFASELVCNLLYLATDPSRPAVGASGAIAGTMGFVMITGPFVKMEFLLLWLPIVRRFEVAAVWMVGFWFLGQLFWWVLLGNMTGVAFAGHVGGFLGGAGIALLMRSTYAKGTSWYIEDTEVERGQNVARRVRMARRARGESGSVKVPRVEFVAIDPEASTVAGIKLLIRWFNFAPEVGKALLDRVREGDTHMFELDDVAAARRFASDAGAVGISVEFHDVPPLEPARGS